jgi:hypothetical protein
MGIMRKVVVAICVVAALLLYFFYWPIVSVFGVHATLGHGDETDGYLARKAYRECAKSGDDNPPTDMLSVINRYGVERALEWQNCTFEKVYGPVKK